MRDVYVKLVRYAADRPRGLLCYLDEMAAWTKKMSDRMSGEDRSTWVQAYEARRYEYDRVSGGAIIAECMAVSVYGNIQPLVYQSAVEALATDGLLQRFIPGVLNSRLTRRGEPRRPAHAASWEHLVRLVYALPAQTYTLAPEAFERFRKWQLWFEQSKRDEVMLEADPAFLTAYGKLEGTAARLALLFHVMLDPFSPSVPLSTLERALDLVQAPLDGVILTHCHLDHLGSLPLLLKQHPSARVYASAATTLFVRRLLSNSIQVMKRQREETGNADYPLYVEQDVSRLICRISRLPESWSIM